MSRNVVSLDRRWICVQSCDSWVVLLRYIVRRVSREARSSMNHGVGVAVLGYGWIVILSTPREAVSMSKVLLRESINLVLSKVGERMRSVHLVSMWHHGLDWDTDGLWPLHLARVLWCRG